MNESSPRFFALYPAPSVLGEANTGPLDSRGISSFFFLDLSALRLLVGTEIFLTHLGWHEVR